MWALDLCCGTEDGAFLAGVWTIVAVAGQTQEHPPDVVVEDGDLRHARQPTSPPNWALSHLLSITFASTSLTIIGQRPKLEDSSANCAAI